MDPTKGLRLIWTMITLLGKILKSWPTRLDTRPFGSTQYLTRPDTRSCDSSQPLTQPTHTIVAHVRVPHLALVMSHTVVQHRQPQFWLLSFANFSGFHYTFESILMQKKQRWFRNLKMTFKWPIRRFNWTNSLKLASKIEVTSKKFRQKIPKSELYTYPNT